MKVELLDKMGTDLTGVNAARVSHDKVSEVFDQRDVKLLNYLANHDHKSPFYHAMLSFRVTAPIYVARQLLRHHVGVAINEMSRRYVDDAPVFEWPTAWRLRTSHNKQSSSQEFDQYQQHVMDEIVAKVQETVTWAYGELLAMGVAPEQARVVLPVSLQTQWIWTGSLYAWYNIWKERTVPGAQKETADVLLEIEQHINEHFPESWKALRV